MTLSTDFAEFVRFSEAVMRTKDFDPNYLVLARVFDLRGYSPLERFNFICCFLCTSHLRSGEQLYDRFRETGGIGDTSNVLMNTQRRGFRANRKAETFFAGTRKLSLQEIEKIVARETPTLAWRLLRSRFEEIPFAGPYHSFKFCDLLKYCLRLPITSPDIGSKPGDTAGAIPGLVRVTGESVERCSSDIGFQWQVFLSCHRVELMFPGMEEFETCLCDFDKFRKRRYYVGQNLDGQMTALAGMPEVYWQARRDVFSRRDLGEFMGWSGERKELRGKL